MDIRIRKMAKLLVDYSCAIKENDCVQIGASPASAELVLALEEEIIRRGAYPLTQLSLPGSEFVYYKYASEKQLTRFPDLAMHQVKQIQVAIKIIDSANTKELASIDPRKLALRAKTVKPISDFITDSKNQIRWCVTLFPTYGLAQEAGMSLREFQDFVFSSLFVNKRDSIGAWRELSKRQQRLTDMLDAAEMVRIIGPGTELTMSVKGRRAVNCDGHYNMPDGEVFTGPIETSVNGKIFFQSFPVIFHGKEVSGISLSFKDGRVVHASAEKNNEFLQVMLNTDEGARYVGELGIGTNVGIKEYIKEILFDEKISGTVHLALGSGYPETGSKNESAIHWDMIMDLRQGGEVYIDGKKLIVTKDYLGLE